MHNIYKYNKFIRLNEDIVIDIRIEGNIDEYDINIIKDGLIELNDLGCEIYSIKKINIRDIRISLSNISKRITQGMEFSIRFDKNSFHMNSMHLYNKNSGEPHEPVEYEQLIINTTKECSQFILNILEYDKGAIYIENIGIVTLINIDLIKN